MAIMKIQERREAQGMKQTEVAVKMGVSQGTISEWEKEIYLPKARQLPLLAHVLGCSIDELFVPLEGAS